jgi:hypothetical protein
VILDLTIIGLAIALYPVALTAFILVLSSRGGTRKGAAYVLGWVASLAGVVAVTVLATGNDPPKSNSAPSLGALAAKIALGTVLLVVALRQYRRLGLPKETRKTPRWQAGVDNMSAWYAVGLAVFAQSWVLVAAGAATVVEAKLSTWADYVTLVYFCLLASSPYLVMEAYATIRPEQSQAFLARLRRWIDAHTDLLVFWISLFVGLWLIGKSTYLIVT